MTQLHPLRYQLSALRRARQTGRWVAAHAALAVAVLWTLGGVFVLDFGFSLSLIQRVIVIGLGIAALVWAAKKYTAPFLGVEEDDLDIALMVERQQNISSDLVAALQFEGPQARDWGSGQLRQRVIDYTAKFSSVLDVFEGFSRPQMVARSLTFLATVIVTVLLVMSFPAHARVFANRLLLGSRHYPSATVLEQIVVNGHPVLRRDRGDEHQPAETKGAQGRPVSFTVQCSGQLPEDGKIRITSLRSGGGRPIELTKLSFEERRNRLESASRKLKELNENPDVDPTGVVRHQIAAAIQFDAPNAARTLSNPETNEQITDELLADVATAISNLEKRNDTALFTGELSTLLDALSYQIFLGDAWTEPAPIRIIPLPIVELRMKPIPPAYAAGKAQDGAEPTARQISVLEGSTVDVSLRVTNEKRLKEAWLVVAARGDSPRKRLPLAAGDDGEWKLATNGTPFENIESEVRFDLQVTDEHNLHLESPIRGYIRLRADRSPTGGLAAVHRVVLPTAEPKLDYRAMDDYGISKLLLRVQIERGQDRNDAVETPADASAADAKPEDKPAPPQESVAPIELPIAGPVLPEKLPVAGKYAISFSKLKLESGTFVKLTKGDRVKLQLEVTDYRGDSAGETYLADPLVFEVSDESGVLAAIGEADANSEKSLTDIINKQLGSGDSP